MCRVDFDIYSYLTITKETTKFTLTKLVHEIKENYCLFYLNTLKGGQQPIDRERVMGRPHPHSADPLSEQLLPTAQLHIKAVC